MSPPKKACIIHDVGNKPYIYVLCLFLLGPVLPTKKTTKVSILSLKFFLQVFLQVQGLNLWKKGVDPEIDGFFHGESHGFGSVKTRNQDFNSGIHMESMFLLI